MMFMSYAGYYTIVEAKMPSFYTLELSRIVILDHLRWDAGLQGESPSKGEGTSGNRVCEHYFWLKARTRASGREAKNEVKL